MTSMRFKNKTVIVTGGDKGIGKAVVLGLATEGANVVIGYNSDLDSANETAGLVEKTGVGFEVVKADVRLKEDCDSLVETAVKKFGRLDIAVNNAGVSTMNWAVDLTEEEWDFNMDVNAKGVFFCCQSQVKQFIKQGGGGRIVNVSSIAGKRPAVLLSHYAASKFAVLGFSKTLALEVASQGITVNCVCPGLVRTSMQEREIGWEAKLRGISKEDVIKEYHNAVPLARLEEPEDTAMVVLFLASDDAGYMTGQAINVAGGMEMAV
jgi:meso-butanediol dehydrogenase/(S,S)-butanediol dehydrogenase/diacetyl reductase